MAGALLIATSVMRAERAAERSYDANMRRELQRMGNTWRRRGSHFGAVAGGAAGLLLLLYSYRRVHS